MKALLPPTQDAYSPPTERNLRRRWRLSTAAATIIAAVIAAGATLLVNRPQQSELRQDIERLERVVGEQRKAIDTLTAAAKENTREVQALRGAMSSAPNSTNTSVERPTGAMLPVSNELAADAATATALRSAEQDRYRFDLQTCKRSGGSVTCHLLITNNDEQERTIIIDVSNKSRVFADNGGVYGASKCKIGTGPGADEGIKLPGHITVPATLYFPNLPSDLSVFTVVQIVFWSSSTGNSRVELRDVTITS